MELRTETALTSTIMQVVHGLQGTSRNVWNGSSAALGVSHVTRMFKLHAEPSNERSGELYRELWQACAGPRVYVPHEGDKVLYFPQGHMEQVEKYTNQDGKVEMPIYDLPPKILCRVVSVQLKAENSTDEVFAQITLVPEANQDDISSGKGNPKRSPQRAYPCFFSKKLTPSDTSTHGGLSIPRRYADKCFPPLDMSQEPPAQELVAKDLHGLEWCFRHIYRGQPRRHLLTSGWSMFAASKKLVSGDAFILLRGENGKLHVGIRHAQTQHNASNSLISGHSMQHGILASAHNAICTGTMFTVYYRPWASHEFIIPLDWYTRLDEIDCSVGTRFRIFCEGEESTERRVLGTIVGIEDIDHIRWPDSEWRCLKVKWDNSSDAMVHPERICPWNIKLIETTGDKHLRFQCRQKRIHAHDASVHGFSKMAKKGVVQRSVNCAPQSPPRVLQGQEFKIIGFNQSGEYKSQLFPYLVLPQNSGFYQMKSQTKKQASMPVCNTFHQYPSGAAIFSGGKAACSGVPLQHATAFSDVGDKDAVTSRKFSVQTVDSYGILPREWITLKLRNENEDAIAEPNGSRYMLFGVSLVNAPAELPSPQVLTSSEIESLSSIRPRSQSGDSETTQLSKPAKSSSDIHAKSQCKNCCTSSSRSCTKVLKHGKALGRFVALTRFSGYEELIAELDQMFDFKGSLIDGSSGWQVTYTDHEGDLMLIGDYLWQDFQHVVRRMLICPKEEINQPNHNSEIPSSQQTLSANISNVV